VALSRPSLALLLLQGKDGKRSPFAACAAFGGGKKAGFEQVEVFGVCGVTFRYVESSLARVLLPFYNLYELLMAVTPWQKNLGTFLITVGVKEGG